MATIDPFMNEEITVRMSRRARVTINCAVGAALRKLGSRLEEARAGGDNDAIETLVGAIFELDEVHYWMEKSL